jgi:anthranilate synthase component 1
MQTVSFDLSWLRKKPQELIVGIEVDYYKLFYWLKQRYRACYLFESLAAPKKQDRYFTLGFDPLFEFFARGDQLTIKGEKKRIACATGIQGQSEVTIDGINPYHWLQTHIPLNRLSKTHQGGLIGYFSYEAINYFEPAIQLSEHKDFYTFHLGLYTDGLIFDTETHVLHYYTFAEDRSSEIKAAIAEAERLEVPEQLLQAVEFHGRSESKEEYSRAVERTLAEIRAGNSFQAEVGFKTYYTIKGEKLTVYNRLRQVNPSPYMFYIQFGDAELLGASPEILVSCTQGRVLTTPAAGTIHRGKDEAEDRALTRQLLSDTKEIAEHNMLVDLHRNDIARVCEVGSVKVAELMYMIRFSHVQHIVTDVVGQLAKEKSVYDLLASILPGGVLTGAPKIETMKIIDRNENQPRGPYGGAVGRFSFNGDATFCMPIRSLYCKGDRCFTQTASGVVYDSEVEKEYEEVCRKLAAMDQTIRALHQGSENYA